MAAIERSDHRSEERPGHRPAEETQAAPTGPQDGAAGEAGSAHALQDGGAHAEPGHDRPDDGAARAASGADEDISWRELEEAFNTGEDWECSIDCKPDGWPDHVVAQPMPDGPVEYVDFGAALSGLVSDFAKRHPDMHVTEHRLGDKQATEHGTDDMQATEHGTDRDTQP